MLDVPILRAITIPIKFYLQIVIVPYININRRPSNKKYHANLDKPHKIYPITNKANYCDSQTHIFATICHTYKYNGIRHWLAVIHDIFKYEELSSKSHGITTFSV